MFGDADRRQEVDARHRFVPNVVGTVRFVENEYGRITTICHENTSARIHDSRLRPHELHNPVIATTETR